MSILELRIPGNTESGCFDTVIVYKEQNFETSLSQFLSITTPLQSADFFEKAAEIAVFYDDLPLTIPAEIAANLLAYLTGIHKVYNLHSEFTCHQFAFLLVTGRHEKQYNIVIDSTTETHLVPGQVIQFVNQEGEFGSSPKPQFVHSAVFLGNGLFFSKNGRQLPGIYTLDALLEIYPCYYITAVTKTTPLSGKIEAKSSIHLSFKNKAYVQNGLAYRAINATSTSFRQLTRPEIARLCRRASLNFHSDRNTMRLHLDKPVVSEQEAEEFLDLTLKIRDFLTDPIKRSAYNVSLLAGQDWSIARILDLSFDSLYSATVKTTFESFIALLNYYQKLTSEEVHTIKSDPRYMQALAHGNVSSNNDLVLQVSNDVARLVNQDPHHPTSVLFEGKAQYLNDTLHYTFSSDTRIGDLKILHGTPIYLCFNKDEFDEQSMQSEEFSKKLPIGLITYSDIKRALELLDLWKSKENKSQSLKMDYLKKKHVTLHPNNLVMFLSTTAQMMNVGVFLGGNFYLYMSDFALKEICICNVSWLQTAPKLAQIVALDRDVQENRQVFLEASSLTLSEAETFPRFTHEQAEAFKRYVLNFLSTKDYQFVPYIHGLKLDKKSFINYSIDEKMNQYFIPAGRSIVLCKGTKIVCDAIHLGNYLFALVSTTGYLRIVNLLMLSETVNWDNLFVMRTITSSEETNPSCEILHYREKIAFGKIKYPLLYAILAIPFDITNLSAVTEQVVVDCYNKRMRNETDPAVIKVLNYAYKLLLNDSYRVFYGSEILFGGESELTVKNLLDINDSTSQINIVKEYSACLKLINNQELQKRISEETTFTVAKKELILQDENKSLIQQQLNEVNKQLEKLKTKFYRAYYSNEIRDVRKKLRSISIPEDAVYNELRNEKNALQEEVTVFCSNAKNGLEIFINNELSQIKTYDSLQLTEPLSHFNKIKIIYPYYARVAQGLHKRSPIDLSLIQALDEAIKNQYKEIQFAQKLPPFCDKVSKFYTQLVANPLTMTDLDETINNFKRLKRESEDLKPLSSAAENQQVVDNNFGKLSNMIISKIEVFLADSKHGFDKDINKELQIRREACQAKAVNLRATDIDAFNQSITSLISSSRQNYRKLQSLLNITSEEQAKTLNAKIEQAKRRMDTTNAVNFKTQMTARKITCDSYIYELDLYIIKRNKFYRLKDVFFAKDIDNRREVITNLKQQLLAYTLDESKAEEIRSFIQTNKNNFPGEKFKPILNRLYLDLGKQESPINITAKKTNHPNVNNAYIYLLEQIDDLKNYGYNFQGNDKVVLDKLCDYLNQSAVGFNENILVRNQKISKDSINNFNKEFRTILHSQDDQMLNHRDYGVIRGLANIAAALTVFILAVRVVYTKFISKDQRVMLFGAKTKRLNKVGHIEVALDHFTDTLNSSMGINLD